MRTACDCSLNIDPYLSRSTAGFVRRWIIAPLPHFQTDAKVVERTELTQVFSSADKALAQRIESGHAFSGVASAQAAQVQNPASTAAMEPIAGGWAVFQGVDLPITQALGIGMAGPVTTGDLDRLEAFFIAGTRRRSLTSVPWPILDCSS
jgi:hypothetical protein